MAKEKTNLPKKTTKKIKRVIKKKLKKSQVKFWRISALVLFGIIIFTQLFEINITPKFDFFGLISSKTSRIEKDADGKVDVSSLNSIVVPAEGVELPINWGDLGKRMIADGVIDENKFRALFKNGLQDSEEQILSGNVNKIVMNQENSRFMLDMLWAFGLSNKNDILENGEMSDEKYGGAGGFASTGGWSLSSGPAMNHYSKHPYVVLTKDQQDLVDRVSKGIFRPCCGNSTHFPDCNHGMAMLGLLELMAANGVSENKMYDVALAVNSYWFPQTYIDLATYFAEQGQDWSQVDSKVVLSAEYSSGQGYAATKQKIESLPKPAQGGGGCGV